MEGLKVKFVWNFRQDIAPIEASVGLRKVARVNIHEVECEKSRTSSSSGAL